PANRKSRHSWEAERLGSPRYVRRAAVEFLFARALRKQRYRQAWPDHALPGMCRHHVRTDCDLCGHHSNTNHRPEVHAEVLVCPTFFLTPALVARAGHDRVNT